MKQNTNKSRAGGTKKWPHKKPVRVGSLKGHGRLRISVVLDTETWIAYHRMIGSRSMSTDLREMIQEKLSKRK